VKTGFVQASLPAQYASSEAEALRAIGRSACSAENLECGFEAISAAVLHIDGMRGVHLELSGTQAMEKGAFPVSGSTAYAVETVRANGLTWGTLRIHFDPTRTKVQTPLRFTRFVGQQIALLLDRLSLLNEIETHRRRLARLERSLATRKAVHRARGQLAQARGVSDLEALLIMKRHARRSGRTLLQLAETLILGFETPCLQLPVLRRLDPGQFTSQWRASLGAEHV
jgi:hypothetical protein